MDDHEAEYEGIEHYEQQQHYSDEEPETDNRDGVNYKTEEDTRYRPKQTTNFNSGADDRTIHESQEHYNRDEHHFTTQDSHGGVTTHSKGNACQQLVSFFPWRAKQIIRRTTKRWPSSEQKRSFGSLTPRILPLFARLYLF